MTCEFFNSKILCLWKHINVNACVCLHGFESLTLPSIDLSVKLAKLVMGNENVKVFFFSFLWTQVILDLEEIFASTLLLCLLCLSKSNLYRKNMDLTVFCSAWLPLKKKDRIFSNTREESGLRSIS